MHAYSALLPQAAGGGAVPAAPAASAAVGARQRALGAFGVTVVAFASIAGGPYGIEAAVGAAGALPTLLGLAATALVWSAPQALVTAELSCAFPSSAGYVGWVVRGLGPAAGFVNAWAMIAAQSLNIPLYPVLIAAYMQQLNPALTEGALWAIKLACLLAAVALNVVGVQAVELASLVMVLLVQTPFILMPAAAAVLGRPFDWGALSRQATTADGSGASSLLSGGQFSVCASTLCWNMRESAAGAGAGGGAGAYARTPPHAPARPDRALQPLTASPRAITTLRGVTAAHLLLRRTQRAGSRSARWPPRCAARGATTRAACWRPCCSWRSTTSTRWPCAPRSRRTSRSGTRASS